ncbi:MAG: hypothetical protein JJ843_00885 [Prochlorococcus marinus CUG1434]|nr:hypothetical protein [Prochlorococcus marinus CUG1434]
MKNFFTLKIFLAIFTFSILVSCSQKKENLDFDFSTLKKSNKVKVNNNDNKDKDKDILENNLFIKDLIRSKNKQEILSKTKFGKEDPFSREGIRVNQLSAFFNLKGFINTKKNKYAFVSYLENEGTISEGYIGGENTYLLPDGAKVISIDPKDKKLIINYENKKFIFEL